MRKFRRSGTGDRKMRLAICLLAVLLLATGPARATILMAKNGMLLEGKLGYLASIDENPLVVNVPEGGVDVKQVVLLDDGLRRTYLSWLQVQEDSLRESDPSGVEVIKIRQNVASGRRQIGSVTSILGIGPFDQWGRRTFSIMTARGVEHISQGITEITPLYTRVEGLSGLPSIRWDCRVATSSIPRETLSQVIRIQGREQGPDARLQAVRLLFGAERYNDARIELQQAMQEFPELGELQDLLKQLKQYSAQRLVDEIQLRQQAGQHQRVQSLLSRFPEDGIAPELLLRVGEVLREYQRQADEQERLKAALDQLVGELKDPVVSTEARAAAQEIRERLNWNSMSRLQDFQRLGDDPQLLPDSRLSLLVSGWILGSGSATQNLMEALSVVRARDLVLAYLRSESEAERTAILERLGREEGGTPQRVAQIIKSLTPPIESAPQEGRPPGNFVFQVPGVDSRGDFAYEVQLPDEYDPYRRYPAIVTLHGHGRTPSDQIQWWAGPFQEQAGQRLGQATRHGYIVIAPSWLRENQRQYEYTGREHAIVLTCLRDACRRFSVDTDRVFLSGHSVGGDAAWDVGLAHPDVWAGVIPIAAVADYGPTAPKYVSQYWENARYVPLYFVTGELDGNKLDLNRRDFDRYLKRSGLDVIIVEYIGRGHEHFYDEIHRLFTWMSLHRRDFYPRQYACQTMRPFDNFFWNLELVGLPEAAMVPPLAWPADSARPAVQEFRKTAVDTLWIETGAEQAWLWLSPDVIALDGRLSITVNGRPRTYDALPQVETLLEDARTRRPAECLLEQNRIGDGKTVRALICRPVPTWSPTRDPT